MHDPQVASIEVIERAICHDECWLRERASPNKWTRGVQSGVAALRHVTGLRFCRHHATALILSTIPVLANDQAFSDPREKV